MSQGAATEIWLVRHGETQWSTAGRHTGCTDVPLTEGGREQARALRGILGGRRFALVLTSPLARARETCELAGYGGGVPAPPDLGAGGLRRPRGGVDGSTSRARPA